MNYLFIAKMITNELLKILSSQKPREFIHQLRLVDAEYLIKSKRMRLNKILLTLMTNESWWLSLCDDWYIRFAIMTLDSIEILLTRLKMNFSFHHFRKLKKCVTWCDYSLYWRVRKSCINDKTIAKITIIRRKLYLKKIMWSILWYSTCSLQSHILIRRWILLIEWSDDFIHNQKIQSLSKHAFSSVNWRLNDFIYFSIKSAVITYINQKMMKHWVHTEK
jgi:hypothetical protein